MKLDAFLQKLPLDFVVECLQAFPGVDRRRLLQAHNCRVKMGPNTLRRKDRLIAEAKRLHKTLKNTADVEDKRSLFQGWLIKRAPLIVGLLNAWEVDHNGGFVEDFDWVANLALDAVKTSIEKVRGELEDEHKELADDKALMVYLGYLEWPKLEELFDIDKVFLDKVES